MLDLTTIYDWSDWNALDNAPLAADIPALPGLYRIRRRGRDDLDYIGQTGSGGMNLRKRLAMLRGVYAAEMPYRDPHTAAPALWALRHSTGCDFEVSVSPVEGTTPWRKGLEALAIALYRQANQRSPNINFGRMPAGYVMSSGNNAKLVAAGKRFRGGYTGENTASHLDSIAPTGSLRCDPVQLLWGGHTWSAWHPINLAINTILPEALGLYHIRHSGKSELLYIGEGRILARLAAHLQKTRNPAHPQGAIFSPASQVECSWVINNAWAKHERLELENDLIASHLLMNGVVPEAQFLG